MPKDAIEEKLEYIGLDLDNIPEFLMDFDALDFRPSKTKEDNVYRVYKFIPVNEIQIMITPKNRLDDITEKYAKASPIAAYLSPDEDENIEKYANFLKMVKEFKLEKVKEIEKEQEQFLKEIPFEIRYKNNHSWQIYYSEFSNKYFMLVPTEEQDYEKLFYLLKMQIKSYGSKKVPYIYVPVNYENYSGRFLKNSEISEIENFLWTFTKNWPNIYEVYDKKQKMTLEIVGETFVYENIKAKYKLRLATQEDALNFYKKMKALFILQTELPNHYKFITKINAKSEIEFYYDKEKINCDDLSEFINKQYARCNEDIRSTTLEASNEKTKLDKLKKISKKQELEYLEKQRQISTYLECKKTFMGKVKYFFKSKKKLNSMVNENETIDEKETSSNNELEIEDSIKKDFYTIEDLITIYYKLDKGLKELNNIKLDITALEYKTKNMGKKIKNATMYIEEIDSHKKSIFEFWKFANKDEVKALAEGENIQENTANLKKVFEYETDFEELGILADRMQRKKLEKEEQDAIYISNLNLIYAINNLDDKEWISNILDELKKSLEEEYNLYSIESFDIFGSIQDNRTKLKNLANKKHREVEKNKYKILEINKNTTVDDFVLKLTKIRDNLVKSFGKVKSIYDMPVYVAKGKDEKLISGFEKYYIDSKSALEEYKNNEKEISLYKINLKEDIPLLYYTNITFFDNYNRTLPEGMNLSNAVLIDNNMYDFELIKKEEFRTNEYFYKEDMCNRRVYVYEYDLINCRGENCSSV